MLSLIKGRVKLQLSYYRNCFGGFTFLKKPSKSHRMDIKQMRTSACKIAVVQMTVSENKEDNWKQLYKLVSEAALDGAKVVFLPEGCDYIASNRKQTIELAEPLNGLFVQNLKKLAVEKRVWISAGGIHITGASNDGDGRISNSHLIINGDGELCAHYCKTHLFSNSIPGVAISEADMVAPGNKLVPPVSSPCGNIGLAVCYDLRFPELCQALRRLGSHVLTFPSAFTVSTGTAHWHTLLRARAIECQSYVVAAAQSGVHNPKRSSYGHALVVDPWGCVVCEVEKPGPGLAFAEIDLELVKKVREQMPCKQHSRQDICGLSLVSFSQPRLLHLEQIPPSSTLYKFGHVTVPGDALFFNSSNAFAFTNLYPRVPGHVMVSSRSVIPRMSDLSLEILSEVAQMTVMTHRLLCKRHSVGDCEVAIQDGPYSGQTVKHVHVHLIPNHSGDGSLLSPDVPQQLSDAHQNQTKEELEVSMLMEAAELRMCYVPESDWDEVIPQPVSMSHESVPEVSPDRNTAFCSRHCVTYIVRGSWQPWHFIVEIKRPIEKLGMARPDEAFDLFAIAQLLQQMLQRALPDISTTFIIKSRNEQFQSVHMHILPWLEKRSPSDAVYDFISYYKKDFGGDSEERLAVAVRNAVLTEFNDNSILVLKKLSKL